MPLAPITVSTSFTSASGERKVNSRMGAALLVHVVADPTRPTEIRVGPNGVLEVVLQQQINDAEALNRALVRYLAHALSLPEHKIEIVAGNNNSGKVVAFYGISVVDLEDRLVRCCGLDYPPRLW